MQDGATKPKILNRIGNSKDISVSKRSWYENKIKSYTLKNNQIENLSLKEFFEDCKELIEKKTLKFLRKEQSIKLNLTLDLLLTRTNTNGDIFYNNIELNSKIVELVYSNFFQFHEVLEEIFTDLVTQSEEYQERESGWAISRVFL